MKLHTMTVMTLLAALAVSGCEEKKATPADASKTMTDSVKGAADATKDAVAGAADKTTEAVKEQVAALTEKAKEAMSGYLAGLGDAEAAMAKIKSALDAPAGMSSLSEASKKVNTNSAILGALPDSEKAAVKDANKDQLASLTAKFKEQVTRLTSDPTLGKTLGDAIKSFKLFE